MKIFRSITFAIGAALTVLCALPAQAIETIRYTVCLVTGTDYHAASAKFDRELAQHRQAKVDHVASVNSDLMREGHGFRQASAVDHEPQMALYS